MQSSRLLRGTAVAASLAAACVFASNTASAQVGYALGAGYGGYGAYGGYGGYGGYAGYGAGGNYDGDPLAWATSLIADTIGLGFTAATAPLTADAWGSPAYPSAYGYPGYGYSNYGYGPGYGYYPSAYGYGAGYAAYPSYGSPYGYGAGRYAYGYGRRMMYRHRYYRGYGYRGYGPGRSMGAPRLRSAIYTSGPRRGRYGHPTMRRHPGMVQGKMIHAKYAQQPIKHYRMHVVRQTPN